MMPSNHLILSYPLLLPSIFPSIRVFSSESALCIRWPKYWRLGISPPNEYSKLISFRIDWLYLFAVQGTLKSPQHHSSKALVWLYGLLPAKWCPCFLILEVCHSFPSREQASFNFMSAVIIHSDFGAQEHKICYSFHFFPSISQEVMGLDAMKSLSANHSCTDCCLCMLFHLVWAWLTYWAKGHLYLPY